jgi:hypothetical protein
VLPELRELTRRYLARGMEPAPVLLDLASMLHNAALESDARGPVTRSSWERVQLAREAWAALDAAREASRSQGEFAGVAATWGQYFATWGFPTEALGAFQSAVEAAPETTWVRALAATYANTVREPMGIPAPAPRAR